MKYQKILFFTSLFSMVLLLSLLPFWNLQYLKVFTSTAQAHSPNDLPASTENQEETATEPAEITEEPSEDIKPDPSKPKGNQDNSTPAEQNDNLPPAAEDENTETDTTPANNTETQEDEQVTPEIKKVYLTIDDGPSPVTDLLLDTLKKYNAHATFFMLETRMNRYPESVTRIADEGHGLGLHGVTHDKKLFYKTPESALAEMKLAQSTLSNLTGITTELIRTPYGSKPYMTAAHKEIMSEAGFIIWDWNVDSKDWYFRDGRLVENTIDQVERLASKGIEPVILLHDTKYTIDYLPQLLTYLLDHQYEFGILDANMKPVVFQ